MSKEDINEISSELDKWLEYGDLKDLADAHLRGKYRYQLASKIKRGVIRNTHFLQLLIEKAIERKSTFSQSAQRLRA